MDKCLYDLYAASCPDCTHDCTQDSDLSEETFESSLSQTPEENTPHGYCHSPAQHGRFALLDVSTCVSFKSVLVPESKVKLEAFVNKCEPAPTAFEFAEQANSDTNSSCNWSAHEEGSCRTYRKNTSALILQLDKLLTARKRTASLDIDFSKISKRKVKQFIAAQKPRPKNHILRETVNLIWKMQCDEQVG